MAVGIYATGSCMGAVIMPRLLELLTKEYGNSGMFLILSALVLNSIPAAILLKDPNNCKKSKMKEADIIQSGVIFSDKLVINHRDNSLTTSNTKNCTEELYHFEKDKTELAQNSFSIRSSQTITFNSECKIQCFTNVAFIDEQKEQRMADTHQTAVPRDNIEPEYLYSERNSKFKSDCKDIELKNHVQESVSKLHQDQKFEEDKEYFKEQQDNNSKIIAPETLQHSKVNNWKSFQLFLDPTFYLTMFVQSAHGFVTTLTWTILIDFSRDNGISTERSLYFIMVLPIAEMFGNLCFNWITDRGFISRTKYCMLCYLILGVDILFVVWSRNFIVTMCEVFIFGCVSGSLATTFPGIIFDFFEKDQQSMALTSRYMLYAFICTSKSPLVGYFRGTLGSYNWVFYIIAISCATSAILVSLTPCFASHRRKKMSRIG